MLSDSLADQAQRGLGLIYLPNLPSPRFHQMV